MASLRVRAPSPSLLRFLRSQSDQLGLWLEPSSASSSASRIACATSRVRRSTQKRSTTNTNTNTNLQASLFDLDGLLRPHATRSTKPLRQAKPPGFFTASSGTRWSSSNTRDASCSPTWRERLFGQPPRRASQPLEPDDLPGGSSGEGDHHNMFNNRRQLRQKAALEPRLRCTEVDEHGNAVLVDGEFKKSELIARVRSARPPHQGSVYRTYANPLSSLAFSLVISARSTHQTCRTSSSVPRPSS